MRSAFMFLLLTGCDFSEDTVGDLKDDCAGCHTPQAAQFVTSRHADPKSSTLFIAMRAEAQRRFSQGEVCDSCHIEGGLTCVTCHGAIGFEDPVPNDAGLKSRKYVYVQGPEDSFGPTHQVEKSEVLTSSALCASCHDGTLAGFEESPYLHWRSSPAAQRGQRCQDCHMSTTVGAGESARVHLFRGLTTDATQLLSHLELSVSAKGQDLLVSASHDGGHHFPDGASFSREVWLEGQSGGVFNGHRVGLHSLHERQGEPTDDPFAGSLVHRGIPAGETVQIVFEQSDAVCLRFRAVNERFSQRYGLPVEELQTVKCVGL